MAKFTQNDVLVCGSMAHQEEWLKVTDELRAHGFVADHPQLEEGEFDWGHAVIENIAEEKYRLNREHLKKMVVARAILVYNSEKNGIANYIGPNTFLEMGMAFALNKPIYVYNPLPEEQANYHEIIGLKPVVIDGDISNIDIGAKV